MDDPALSNEDEVNRYMAKEFSSIPKDLGEFWFTQSKSFRTLSKVSRSILSIACHTSENERYFSKLARLLSDYRHDLSAIYSTLIAHSLNSLEASV